jgi:hypothetical protein
LITRGRLLIAFFGAAIGIVVYGGLSGGWLFIDRFSWIVIIVSLPVGVYQLVLLQMEQVRIANEVSRRPILMNGFTLKTDRTDVVREIHVVPQWPESAGVSKPFRLKWLTFNCGTRTAREVLINWRLPENLAAVQPPNETIVRHLASNEARRVGKKFDLNPDDLNMVLDWEFVFPAGEPLFQIKVTTSMFDTAEQSETLILHVEQPPPGGGPPQKPRSGAGGR